jgi:CopG family nickel-responsive transcriptional regulator
MTELLRFGVSLEQDLLQKFDQHIRKEGYTNRSEAIRDLIRKELVKKRWQEGKETAGAITLVYDHHRSDLLNKLIDMQHDYQQIILSSQHVHLDHDNCLEIIAVKGDARKVDELAGKLKSLKGVKHGTLSMSSIGKDLL